MGEGERKRERNKAGGTENEKERVNRSRYWERPKQKLGEGEKKNEEQTDTTK